MVHNKADGAARVASIWAVLGSLGTRGLSFVFFLLIARALSPAEMGVMALALAVGMFADAVIDFGLSTQVNRYEGGDSDDFLTGVFGIQVFLAMAFASLLVIGAGPIASWYGEPTLKLALWGVALASFLNALGLVPTAMLSRRLQHRSIALRHTVATLVGGVFGVWLAHTGAGIGAVVVMHVANAATGVVIVWVAVRWRPLSFAGARQYLLSTSPVWSPARHQLATQLLEASMVRLDQLLIGTVFGASTLGVYSLAVRIFDVLFQVTCAPIASVLLPFLARAAGDLPLFRAQFVNVLTRLALLTPPIYVCAALYADVGVSLLFGDKWRDAVPYLQWALAMGAVQSVGFVHPSAFIALGRSNVNLWVALISSGLWLAGLFALPQMAPLFAMILWVGRSAVGLVLQLMFARRLIGVEWGDYWRAVRWPLVTCAVVVGMAWATDHGRGVLPHDWQGFVLMTSISFGVFLMQAWFLSEDVRQLVQKKWPRRH